MSVKVQLGILVAAVWLLALCCAKDDLAAPNDLWNKVILRDSYDMLPLVHACLDSCVVVSSVPSLYP